MDNKIGMIKEIVAEAQRLWDASGKNTKTFPTVCAGLLSKIDLRNLYTSDFLGHIATHSIGRQYYTQNDFSNLPICLAFAEDVFMDLYVWTSSDTNIHNHCFVGAFSVLIGEVTQTQYQFNARTEVADGLHVGDCLQTDQRTIKVGDIQTIEFLDEFIHQSIHTHSETIHTVTLCLRTTPIPGSQISSFLLPHIKYAYKFIGFEDSKRLDIAGYLYFQNPEENLPIVMKALEKIPLNSRLNLLNGRSASSTFVSPQIIDLIQRQMREEFGSEQWFKDLSKSLEYQAMVTRKLNFLKAD